MIFFMISYMHITLGQGQITPGGQSFDFKLNLLIQWPNGENFKKISLNCDFIQMYFMISYMYIAQGKGK